MNSSFQIDHSDSRLSIGTLAFGYYLPHHKLSTQRDHICCLSLTIPLSLLMFSADYT